MNSLEKYNLGNWFGKECTLRGIDSTTIDFEAEVDSTLSYYENKEHLSKMIDRISPAEKLGIYEDCEREIAKRDMENAKLKTKLAKYQKIMQTRPSEYIRRLCRNLGLSWLVERETWELSKKLSYFDLAQPETIPALICLASRKHGIPIPPRKVAELADVERKPLLRKYWRLAKKFGLDHRPLDTHELLSRAGERLPLSEHVLERARVILEVYESNNGQGKNPRATVAATIHIVARESNIQLAQRRLSEVLSVAPSTIRDRVRDMRNWLLYAPS